MNIPQDLRYTKEHEWIRLDGDTATIGITDFAQRELGDIVFVELQPEGTELEAGAVFGTVEAVKTVSELYMPIAGTIAETNADLEASPESVNEDPYGRGWMVKVRVKNPGELDALLSAHSYASMVGGSVNEPPHAVPENSTPNSGSVTTPVPPHTAPENSIQPSAHLPHVPMLNFTPELVYLTFKNHKREELEVLRINPLYGGWATQWTDEDTINAIRKYADWCIADRVTGFMVVDHQILNMSNKLMVNVTVDLDNAAAAKWRRRAEVDESEGKNSFELLPDVGRFEMPIKEFVYGYIVRDVFDDGTSQGLFIEESDVPRDKQIQDLVASGCEDLGYSRFGDPFTGHKLRLENATRYIGNLTVMPITT